MANIEKLAEHAHQVWSDWIAFMLQIGDTTPQGQLIIKPDTQKNWRRQAETAYDALTDREKDSDRKVATSWLEVFEANRRCHLPDTRRSVTVKTQSRGMDMYVTVGFYSNGEPGEVFVTVAKIGSDVAAFVNGWAVMVSVALQFGVPWNKIRDKFINVPDSMLADAVRAAQEAIDASSHSEES